ncbi:DUF4011 domain-containing protein [Rhodopirellula europaea]|uniref:DUF4011 domain-containing protein n=1 Tax=Rhodopirellula europaea TaxID=1263866 RepID=UPI003D28FF63
MHVESESPNQDAANCNDTIHSDLESKLEGWRERLLDLGNRNPLINCRFTERSNLIEFDTPSTEVIWRTLAADSEAGASSMRFPWRRDLVPPPDDWQEFEEEPSIDGSSDAKSDSGASNMETVSVEGDAIGKAKSTISFQRRKRRPWNPPIAECRQSPRLTTSDLLVDRTDTALDRKLRKLAGDAQLSMSEQGVHSLYAAFGFLKWYESVDSGEERVSPLILVPVSLSRETTSAPWELTEAEDDALDNLCLRQRLWQDFKLELPPLPELSELEEPEARQTFLEKVRAAIAVNDRWEVEDRCAIGRFAFPKIAMWQDLGQHAHAVMGNDHCRILGGDEGDFGDEPFGPISDVPTSRELDDVLAPGEVKTILDCDSSQLEAIAAAREGVSFVLDGPPGTGKSQTIANIIADALSVGRKILFVSEKIAALEVVKKRLEDRGLGDFCLECHSSKANRRSVLFEMERCLDLPAEVYKDSRPKLDELAEQRGQLNRYARELHQPRDPLGFSPFELFGRISRLKADGAASRTRCVVPANAKASRFEFDSSLRLLERASDFGDLLNDYDNHPWRGCHQTTRSLSLHDDLKHHLQILADRCLRIAALFEPLVSKSLIEPVTLTNLESHRHACENAIMTPEMPASWLTDPARSSLAIVNRINADIGMASKRGTLAVLASPDDPSLPTDAVRSLLASTSRPDPDETLPGLEVELPRTLVAAGEATERQLQRLSPVTDAIERLRQSLSEAGRKAKLKLPDRATIQDIGEFAKAIEAAGEIGIGQPAWLDAKAQPSIETLAAKAIAIATKNEALAGQLSSLIPTPQVLTLADRLHELDGKIESIRQVGAMGTQDLDDLDAAERSLSDAALRLTKLDEVQRQLSVVLGLSDADWENVSLPIGETTEATQQLERAGVLLGGLKDPDDRIKLRKVCDEAIRDLEDAESIRSEFGDRLSHRAFRESSEPVVAKGTAFVSLWKRWFGGYAKYRIELADFYSGEVPKGSDLLDDVVMLERFHRRQSDVQSAAAHWSDRLSDDFDALQQADWSQLADAVDAVEQLHKTWPSLAGVLPDRPASVTGTGLSDALKSYVDCKNGLATDALVTKSPSNDAQESVAERLDHIQQQRDRMGEVAQMWRTCNRVMSRPLNSPDELATIIGALQAYRQLATNLTEGAQKYAGWFPRNAATTKLESWLSMQRGVETAKRFASLGIGADILGSMWCIEPFADQRSTWESVGADLQRLQVEFIGSVRDAGIELDGKPLNEISRIIFNHHDSLTNQFGQIQSIGGTLKDDADPSLEELGSLANSVASYQKFQEESRAANSELQSLNIQSIGQADLKAAQWLAEAVASDRVSELGKSVATDGEVRRRVAAVLDETKSIADDEWHSAIAFLKRLFPFDQPVVGESTISNATLHDLGNRCRFWLEHTESFDQWIAFARLQSDVHEAGFAKVIEELIEQRYSPEATRDVIAMQVYRELFDALARSDRHFGEFDINQHERVRDRFRQLDQWEVQAAATQIRQYQLGRADRPSNSFAGADSSELGILQKEIAKKRKHKPLRRLFTEIPTVLQRLKPCVMMSPLSVSTFLDCDEIRFDLVIFDEASQVFPWDALGAIYRGTQLIVAGDEKQLPPTNFFSRQDAETDDEEDDIGDYESILSLCKSVGMPNKRLKWHYRSKREPLIAFSNRHFYDGELVTFPSVDDGDGVSFEYVPEGRWIDRKNLPEAERVVQMIVDHIRKHPDKSLGVIALNSTHQRAIEDTLYDLRRDRPDIDALFHGSSSFGTTDENLFIKNLENVQGDERDFIFLSLGYGFNNVGKFNKNFGPINKQHGERRLNVAITRARESLTFVASVRSADMDLSGTKSEGAHLLKSYLSYAEKGVDTLDLAMQEIAGEADSPFEEEVAAALIRIGLQPVSQVGCGGFRIDLALKHPDRPGQFCLAIECDGATYHSSHTARDRDRIRQTILESLGWTIIRVWSTDWVRNPDRQIERILEAYEKSLLSPINAKQDSQDDVEEDLEPTFIQKEDDQQRRAKLSFDSIDEVPDDAIHLAATYVLTQAGAMTVDDLVRQTSRELGFRRTGQKIRSRIECRLNADLENGSLIRTGHKIAVSS